MPYASTERRLAYHRDYNSLYWKTLPTEHRNRLYDNRRLRGHSKRHFLAGYKLFMGCVDCGYDIHPAALDFDHVRGDKEFTLAQTNKFGWLKFVLELEKCEVRCSNCHRIRHYEVSALLDQG